MKTISKILSLLGIIILSGCMTLGYGPKANGGGYEDTQIDGNTYMVAYDGSGLPTDKTEMYLLYRCAELTGEKGFDYFVIIDKNSATSERTTVKTDVSDSEIGSFKETKSKTTVRSSTIYTATKMIRMFKGTKPEGDFQAFNAAEVARNLESKVIRR